MAVTKSCFSGVTGELGMAEDHETLIFIATLEPATAFDLQLHSVFVHKAQELSVLILLLAMWKQSDKTVGGASNETKEW